MKSGRGSALPPIGSGPPPSNAPNVMVMSMSSPPQYPTQRQGALPARLNSSVIMGSDQPPVQRVYAGDSTVTMSARGGGDAVPQRQPGSAVPLKMYSSASVNFAPFGVASSPLRSVTRDGKRSGTAMSTVSGRTYVRPNSRDVPDAAASSSFAAHSASNVYPPGSFASPPNPPPKGAAAAPRAPAPSPYGSFAPQSAPSLSASASAPPRVSPSSTSIRPLRGHSDEQSASMPPPATAGGAGADSGAGVVDGAPSPDRLSDDRRGSGGGTRGGGGGVRGGAGGSSDHHDVMATAEGHLDVAEDPDVAAAVAAEATADADRAWASKRVDEWSVEDVIGWLSADVKVPRVHPCSLAFRVHGVDGAALLSLSVQDLMEMGVEEVGVRRRVLVEVERLTRSLDVLEPLRWGVDEVWRWAQLLRIPLPQDVVGLMATQLRAHSVDGKSLAALTIDDCVAMGGVFQTPLAATHPPTEGVEGAEGDAGVPEDELEAMEAAGAVVCRVHLLRCRDELMGAGLPGRPVLSAPDDNNVQHPFPAWSHAQVAEFARRAGVVVPVPVWVDGAVACSVTARDLRDARMGARESDALCALFYDAMRGVDRAAIRYDTAVSEIVGGEMKERQRILDLEAIAAGETFQWQARDAEDVYNHAKAVKRRREAAVEECLMNEAAARFGVAEDEAERLGLLYERHCDRVRQIADREEELRNTVPREIAAREAIEGVEIVAFAELCALVEDDRDEAAERIRRRLRSERAAIEQSERVGREGVTDEERKVRQKISAAQRYEAEHLEEWIAALRVAVAALSKEESTARDALEATEGSAFQALDLASRRRRLVVVATATAHEAATTALLREFRDSRAYGEKVEVTERHWGQTAELQDREQIFRQQGSDDESVARTHLMHVAAAQLEGILVEAAAHAARAAALAAEDGAMRKWVRTTDRDFAAAAGPLRIADVAGLNPMLQAATAAESAAARDTATAAPMDRTGTRSLDLSHQARGHVTSPSRPVAAKRALLERQAAQAAAADRLHRGMGHASHDQSARGCCADRELAQQIRDAERAARLEHMHNHAASLPL